MIGPPDESDEHVENDVRDPARAQFDSRPKHAVGRFEIDSFLTRPRRACPRKTKAS
jgi:hypothetical protein